MKAVLAVLATMVAVVMSFPGAARADSASHAGTFVRLVNELRARHGAPALEAHPELEAKAAGWARVMADAGRIWHSNLADGITADWSALGENVGMGGSVERLHDAFVNSPRHYDNLVKASYEYVGIAVVDSDGVLYVAQAFMTLNRPTPAPPRPAPASASPAAARPTAPPAPPVSTPSTVPAPRAAPAPRTPPKPAAPAVRRPVVAGDVLGVPASPAPAPAGTTAPVAEPVPAPAEGATVAAQPPAVEVTTETTAQVSPVRAGTSWLAFLFILTVTAGALAVQLRVRDAHGGRCPR